MDAVTLVKKRQYWWPDTCECWLAQTWVDDGLHNDHRKIVPHAAAPCPAHRPGRGLTLLLVLLSHVPRLWTLRLHRHGWGWPSLFLEGSGVRLPLVALDRALARIHAAVLAENQWKNNALGALQVHPALRSLQEEYACLHGGQRVRYADFRARMRRVIATPPPRMTDWAPGVIVTWAIDPQTRLLSILTNVTQAYRVIMQNVLAASFPGVVVRPIESTDPAAWNNGSRWLSKGANQYGVEEFEERHRVIEAA